MTMKRGGWGVRCGVRARLAAEESLPGIVSFWSPMSRDQRRDYSRVRDGDVCGSRAAASVSTRAKMSKYFHIYGLVLPF